MTRMVTRSLPIAAVAFLALAASGVAQTRESPILNTLQVQKLAKSTEPGDNATLAAHFRALADRYRAEAERHTSMAKSFGGNRHIGAGMPVHCTRIAELNTDTSTTLRELAAHHQKVAAGTPSIAPPGSAAFQGGLGAREPTGKELTALAARASSISDHRALEEYFLTAAKRYTAEAREHAAPSQTYVGTRMAWAPAIHDRLADLARKSARQATVLATLHKDMAGLAR